MALLGRSYMRSRNRLLLWSALAFVGLALNNLVVVCDLIIWPVEVDLLPLRYLLALAGLGVLLYGFIWEAD